MNLNRTEKSRMNQWNGLAVFRCPVVLLSFLILHATRLPGSELDRLNVWAYVENGVCIAGRTTEVSFSITNNADEQIRDLTVMVREGEDPKVVLISGSVGRIDVGETRTVTSLVTPGWRNLRRWEKVALVLVSGGVPVTHMVQFETAPVPWFWPAIGGVLGLMLLAVFILLFRKMNKEENHG
jgi:hypothetical protein